MYPNFLKGRILSATLTLVGLLAAFLCQAQAALPGGTLDPASIPKFVTPLVIPPEMPQTPNAALNNNGIKYYEIAVRQFVQQILPLGLPETTVWSYGSVNHPNTFNYPAFTIEATADQPVRVKWINDLKDPDTGDFLPHLLPVDQTLHWANPPGGLAGRDGNGSDPNLYTGPVPMITHVHGAHVGPESDGHPEAWYLPAAGNIASSFADKGSHYGQYDTSNFEAGTAVFQYPNDQQATTLWYHDHSLGMTRQNVYAGPAGFYLLRGAEGDLPAGTLPGPAPRADDQAGTNYYEIPIVIQDRSFNSDGSLFYPDSRAFFDDFQGPYIGDNLNRSSDVPPAWNPEFFGNTIVVNGKTWPYLNVEPRKYRFRILNGSNSRFFVLKFDKNVAFTQIGADGGFLAKPAALTQLVLGPAERADVIVDFSNLYAGENITLMNLGPDSPFGGMPIPRRELADPATTGLVMQFNVVAMQSEDSSVDPARLTLPKLPKLSRPSNVRKVSLNEEESARVCVDAGNLYIANTTPPECEDGDPLAPVAAKLGIIDQNTGFGIPKMWDDAITEYPALGSVEEWEISNFTEDAHPIHLHMVQFQVVERQSMGTRKITKPEPWETGYKDTVVAFPGEVTRIKAKFDIGGLFVWHCHILEHEDNEMMRPYCVGNQASCQ